MKFITIKSEFIILRNDLNKLVNNLEDSLISSISLEFDESK